MGPGDGRCARGARQGSRALGARAEGRSGTGTGAAGRDAQGIGLPRRNPQITHGAGGAQAVRFTIQPEVLDRFPGITLVVAVGLGLDPERGRAAVTERWRRAWREAAAAAAPYGNAQSHPRVAPWRQAFRAMAVPPRDYPSSIEAMLRRALKSPEPFFLSPLVDFYNAVSLTHAVPAGGFDLARIRSEIALRFTRAGDQYLALDAQQPVAVPEGEVAYADGSTILTRQFVWRQAQEGLIRPDTRDVFLVSEVLGPVGRDAAGAVLEDLAGGLATLFGADVRRFVMGPDHLEAQW
jgi:DNA/RNA-binding domain of Phe-tRNA-synthetase-like protein